MKTPKGRIITRIESVEKVEWDAGESEFVIVCTDITNETTHPVIANSNSELHKRIAKWFEELNNILDDYYYDDELFSPDEVKEKFSNEFSQYVGEDSSELQWALDQAKKNVTFCKTMINDITADPDILDCPSEAPGKIQEYKKDLITTERKIAFITDLLKQRGELNEKV